MANNFLAPDYSVKLNELRMPETPHSYVKPSNAHNSQAIVALKMSIVWWIKNEPMEYYSDIRKEWNIVIYNNIESNEDHFVRWNKSGIEKQVLCNLIYAW